MFGIRRYISSQKEKFRKFKTEKGQLENIKKAEELEKLRKERIRLEGKAELEKLTTEEKGRIGTARKETSKVRKFATGLAKHMNKGKEHLKKVKEKGKGIDFGTGGSDGAFDFGGKGGSPFG